MPNDTSYILGISCYYHDAAACIIKDGVVIAAAAEERFSRIKHDNTFPHRAIEFCIREAGIAYNELNAIVFYEKPIIKFERILSQHLEYFPRGLTSFVTTAHNWLTTRFKLQHILQEKLQYHGKLYFIDHHLSHAASAYCLSGFTDAVTVTLDGVGEWATTTIGTGSPAAINLDSEIHFPHSLGLLYSALTSFLGFSVNDAEYKVMGLAAYGNPTPFKEHFKQLITTYPDGSYRLNMSYFDFTSSKQMFTARLIELFGTPPRLPESPMQPVYENIAAALQARLEEVVFSLLNAAYKQYKNPRLCMAGGVALNSVLNGKILSHTPFKELYIPPDPGDAGGAMGAALYGYFFSDIPGSFSRQHPKKKHQKEKIQQLQNAAHTFTPYLGPNYSWFTIASALTEHNLSYQFVPTKKKLIRTVAKLLASEAVIGWFTGKMEWGPRALGARSILASAARTEMRDLINEKVKHRELFRPFAPVILEEKTHSYFDADIQLPISARYMLMVYPFKKKAYSQVPAVVHVDGSGRLQTLAHSENPLYYELIEEYSKITGVPIIINTSFNVRGEPIVCTPSDAINCFLKTDIDYLVMDQYIISKGSI